jgi:dTDP-4-amino-4,6-dideoxygalactose transaminase
MPGSMHSSSGSADPSIPPEIDGFAVEKIAFYRHGLGQAELDEIAKVFAQPILTTGAVVEEVERRFAGLLGAKHALAVTSCTGAMHMALAAYGIGPGDEVITTPMTFIATAAAILEAGARPVFADVEKDTGNIDAEQVAAAVTSRTKAILPVHLYGQMVDMRALRAIADKDGLRIIEDSAHCIEGERDGVKPGQVSDAACFSFFATKNMTCGEGGAITVNDDKVYRSLRLLRLHGMDKTSYDRHREGYRHWDVVEIGWKYNMSNIEAAILLPQFGRLTANLERRAELDAHYRRRLHAIAGVTLPAARPGVHARHLFVVWVENRDAVVAALRDRGIETVVNYRPIHLTTYLARILGHKPGDFPVSEWLGERCISLPFYPSMRDRDVDTVCDALEEILAPAARRRGAP